MLSTLMNIWRSRLFKLTISILLLTLSVMMFADFFKLRGDVDAGIRDARKAMSEALAVQLTVLAGSGNEQAIRQTVDAFVTRSTDVGAARLTTTNGTTMAASGDLNQLSTDTESTLSQMVVPIFQNDRRWGEVRVAFAETQDLAKQLTYFGFIGISCFVLYLLFLRKALNQIDPSQVVPGRVNNAFNLLSEGIVILDTKLQVMLANDAMGRIIRRTPGDLMGQHIDEWPWEFAEDQLAPWRIALEDGGTYASQEPLTLRTPDKQSRRLIVNCAVVGAGEDEKAKGLLVTFDDMTAIEEKNRDLQDALRLLKHSQVSIQEKNKELEALATQDPLTGVNNRRALLARLATDFAKSMREDRPLSVIMVDIDHFKSINDTFGHVVGDDCIRVVANTLAAQCREYDLVGRYGGEEFVVVLPDLTAQQAHEVAERMRLQIADAATNENLPLQEMTASLGVACTDSMPDDYMALIDHADQALYAAKQGGRNRSIIFDSRVTKIKPEAGATAEVESDRRSQKV